MHNRGMIYGYARVSTAAQDETGQVRQLKAAGCEKVFREKITGTTANRPRLRTLAARGARQMHHLAEMVERDAEHTAILNSLKQVGLYTDCYGSNAHWSEPKEIIDSTLARTLVGTAELLSKEKIVSPREIELWVEHLSPVLNTPEMPHALLRWATALH